MYLDELDTVRFDVRNKDYESNYVFAQAAMMKNIIQGQTITLSQTQLFDSGIILKLLKQENAFVKLFEDGIINVSVFHKDLKRLHTDNFKDVVIDKLSQGIDGDDRQPFYFSGIDALNNKKLYSDNKEKNISELRKIAIHILRSDKTSVDYPLEHKEYFEGLMNFAEVINTISEPITKKGLKTSPTSFTLSDLVEKHLQKVIEYPWPLL